MRARRATFLLLLALAACGQQAPGGEPASEIAAPAKGLDRSHAGARIPDAAILSADGVPASLADEAGEPVLVNLWATWCAPCVKELPTLAALGSRSGAPRVIAVSQDIAPRTSIDAFLKHNGISGLEVWHDKDMALSGALDAQILPTTILYDSDGREVWRYVGDLDWSGTEAEQLLLEAEPEA